VRLTHLEDEDNHFARAEGSSTACLPGRKAEADQPRACGGAIVDVMVDLRRGSPTFGAWHVSHLDEDNMRSVYLPGRLCPRLSASCRMSPT
jgi:dTDP-4-dehydrorhamnose 3,5-epimerase